MLITWRVSFEKKFPANIQLYKHPSRLPLLRTVDERETNRVSNLIYSSQVQVAQHHLRRKLRGYDVTNIPFKNNKLSFLLRFEGQSMYNQTSMTTMFIV